MNDTPEKKRPLGALLMLAALLFLLSPIGSEWTREMFLSFKNGNIVGTQAPSAVDGTPVAAAQEPPQGLDAGAQGFALWTFFSPT